MAEFTDVMEQAKRICKAHIPCTRCALYQVHIGGNCAFDNLLSENFDDVERRIRAWAEKHPDGDKPEHPAEVAEKPAEAARRGTWKPVLVQRHAGAAANTYYACSECSCVMTCRLNYCPNCGARMGGDGA